jgi:hypothetical protein
LPDFQRVQFVVAATGPTGAFWLSKLNDIGLRTLVTRDQAFAFASAEDAQRAIKAMPEGYKLARISFAIELVDELRAADGQTFRDAGVDSTAELPMKFRCRADTTDKWLSDKRTEGEQRIGRNSTDVP